MPKDNTVQKILMGWNNFTRADFMRSKSLEKLELMHNKISELKILNNYPSLLKLDIRNNQIETLDFTVLNLPSLEILDAGMPANNTDNNRIRRIITKRSAHIGSSTASSDNLRKLFLRNYSENQNSIN
jgi:Leucine-rich repeat (LRR) protein